MRDQTVVAVTAVLCWARARGRKRERESGREM